MKRAILTAALTGAAAPPVLARGQNTVSGAFVDARTDPA
jgi:hypothetical protein